MKSFETVERFCSCKKAHVICSEELLLVKPWKLAFAFLFLSVLNFGLKYQILGSEKGQKKKTKKTKQNQNKTNKRATKKSRYIDTYQANIITTRDGFQEMLSSSKIQTWSFYPHQAYEVQNACKMTPFQLNTALRKEKGAFCISVLRRCVT